MPSVGAEAVEGLVRSGREALAAADWERARSSFEQARRLAETAEILDGLSDAIHFQGGHVESIELKERAFATYERDGRRLEAAEAARWLAFLHGRVHGNVAACNGWMARAERLLDGVEESAEHGRFALDRAPWTNDPAERERHAMNALTIARRIGDRDLEFSALALLGSAHVAAGRVTDGMSLLDEAMTAISGGEVTRVESIGGIYCRLLGACALATDVSRAEQWIAAARRFVAWGDFVPPLCRLSYGTILIAVGRWPEAEEELLAAARTFERGYATLQAAPLVKLAGLRVRQGRLEEAERLLEGRESRPGARQVLAMIALARGDLPLAEDLARLCLEGDQSPDLGCVPVLELLVEVHVARSDLDGAQEAVGRLEAIAADYRDDRTAAAAQLAAGRLSIARGDDRARSHLHAALETFTRLDLPLEAGRAQLELARALGAEARAGATAEAHRALATFERLGAARDVAAAVALLRTLEDDAERIASNGSGVLTRREREVLALLAAGCSNAEIAERLYISPRTAERHVANILSKLRLRSRAAAAAYAARELSGAPAAE